MSQSLFEGQFAEVFVFGHQDARFPTSLGEDKMILGGGEAVADPDHVMAFAAKRLSGRAADVLVKEQLQWAERAGRGNTASCARIFSA